MRRGLALLDKAVGLAEEELRLLQAADSADPGEAEDQEEDSGLRRLAEHSIARDALIRRAWQEREACSSEEFSLRLVRLRELQLALAEKAEALLQTARLALGRDKKTRQAIVDYCRTGLGRAGGARVFRRWS